MVNRISSERKVRKNFGTSKFEYSEGPLRDVLRTSWGHPELTSQGRPLNVGLGRPLNIISGHPLDVRLGRTRDVRSRHPRDGQIGSLGDVLRMSWEPIFAGWAATWKALIQKLYITKSQNTPQKCMTAGLLIVPFFNMTTPSVLLQYTKTVL